MTFAAGLIEPVVIGAVVFGAGGPACTVAAFGEPLAMLLAGMRNGGATRVQVSPPQRKPSTHDLYGTETVQAARELGVPDERITAIAAQVDGITPGICANAAPGAIEEIARRVAARQLRNRNLINLDAESVAPAAVQRRRFECVKSSEKSRSCKLQRLSVFQIKCDDR